MIPACCGDEIEQSALCRADYASRVVAESRWGIRKRSVLSGVVVVTFSLLVGGAFLLLVLFTHP
jgi:hypothetical protein